MVIASSMHPGLGELRTLFLEGVTRSSKIILSSVNINRPVSYSNGWTGSSMRWRLMRAN